jgi:predicted TIM-barrel fold metal-dependent hydrolase
MPRITVLDLAQEEQAQLLAALWRTWYGYLLHGVFAHEGWCCWCPFGQDSGFAQFKLSVVGAFHDLLMKGTPAKFPDLRWAFIEVSSQWIPYALNDMELRFRRGHRPWLGPDPLRENRVYVACQTTDHIPYVLRHAGDDNIVIGTDYGHNDTSSELVALRKLREDGKIDQATADKFLDSNPKRLYGL